MRGEGVIFDIDRKQPKQSSVYKHRLEMEDISGLNMVLDDRSGRQRIMINFLFCPKGPVQFTCY